MNIDLFLLLLLFSSYWRRIACLILVSLQQLLWRWLTAILPSFWRSSIGSSSFWVLFHTILTILLVPLSSSLSCLFNYVVDLAFFLISMLLFLSVIVYSVLALNVFISVVLKTFCYWCLGSCLCPIGWFHIQFLWAFAKRMSSSDCTIRTTSSA